MNEFIGIIRFYLDSLDDKKVYKLIPTVVGEDIIYGGKRYLPVCDSITITKNVDQINLAEKLRFDINRTVSLYNIDSTTSELLFLVKE
jgi:hypothetical protein